MKYFVKKVTVLTSFAIWLCCFSYADQNETDYKASLKKRAMDSSNTQDENLILCKPRHIHLSFGDQIVDMKIMWATVKKCGSCEVSYGIQAWSLDKNSKSVYTNFAEANAEGLQHLYLSELRNLQPNTTYYYMPLCESSHSGPFYFHIPPVAQNLAAEYLIFGDMGIQTHSIKTVIQEAQSGHYTAVIHAGDFAYNFYDQHGLVGDSFMEMIEPAASFVPYMTSPGNHEMEDGKFYHYRHRFSMPNADWPMSVNKLWYSIDIGLVHFVSYSSEVFFTNDGKYVATQKRWLIEDLKLANSRRNVTPWVIAFGHRPLYCSTRIGDDCSLEGSLVRFGLEEIFYNMKVDIILQAHEHNYERLWPMFQGLITDYSYDNASAPIQIISGAAGSHYGTDHFVNGDQPNWSAFRAGEPALNSYGRMVVENETHIWWEQRSALDHSPIDGIWITKEPMFEWHTIGPVAGDNIIVIISMGILGVCFALVVIAFIVKFVVRCRRRRQFSKAWHTPVAQDEDDEDDEIEEFTQKDYTTSLVEHVIV